MPAESSLTREGYPVIGDIAFPTDAVLAGARDRWSDVWDHDEYYWAADEALDALRGVGWNAEYEQISVCAGLFTIKP